MSEIGGNITDVYGDAVCEVTDEIGDSVEESSSGG